MDKNNIIQKLKSIKPELEVKFGVSELALFGSYSRNEQTSKSDIDVLVDFTKKLGIEYFDLVYLIQAAFPESEVQVVSKGGIRPIYFEAIKNDLIYA